MDYCSDSIDWSGLNGRGKWQGFLFWLVSNAYWGIFSIINNEYPEAALFVVFWITSLYGIFHWRNKQKEIAGYKEAVRDFAEEDAHKKELDNKRLSILLDENARMGAFIAGLPYYKKAKKRLRIDVPTTSGKKG